MAASAWVRIGFERRFGRTVEDLVDHLLVLHAVGEDLVVLGAQHIGEQLDELRVLEHAGATLELALLPQLVLMPGSASRASRVAELRACSEGACLWPIYLPFYYLPPSIYAIAATHLSLRCHAVPSVFLSVLSWVPPDRTRSSNFFAFGGSIPTVSFKRV